MSEKLARNSNIELFRILAAFSVLIVHFNGWFVGGLPNEFDFENITAFRIGQLCIESLSVVCVNSFLLISGYFGIKLSLKSIYKFIILLLGIYIPMYLLNSLLYHSFSIKGLIISSLPISNGGYFVQGYFVLMLVSPLLNSFVSNSKRNIVLYLTLLLLSIELYFDGLRDIEAFGINGGYSVMHFCIMYLVGRTISLFKQELTKYCKLFWISGYIFFSLVTACLYVAKAPFAFDYSSPFVIAASVCSFIPFLYKEFVNKKINWIAKGTFAVYLLQVTNPLYSLLVKTDNILLSTHPYGLYLIFASFEIIAVFIICIIYDKIREFVTNLFSEKLFNSIECLWSNVSKKLNLS